MHTQCPLTPSQITALSNIYTSAWGIRLSEKFSFCMHVCVRMSMCKIHCTIAGGWQAAWKWADRPPARLSGVAGGNSLKETEESMSYWISQGSRELHRREGKGRRRLCLQTKAALCWEWKKLNITDERTMSIMLRLILPRSLCSENCWTACLVTTRLISLSFLSFPFPSLFPPLPSLLQFPLQSLLNVITKNQTLVKQKQRSTYLQCQLAKHTLQLF